MPATRANVVAIGELLWDLLPAGRQLGGAPANFAVHARGLGADARLVSRVGADDLGREAVAALRKRGLPADTIQVDPAAPTGTVEVALNHGQPTYTIVEDVAWDRLEADAPAKAAVAAADAVCFGSLGQRTEGSHLAVRELVANARRGALRVFDVNLRPPWWSKHVVEESLELADVLKLNDEELSVLAAAFGLGGDVRADLAGLADGFGLKLVALTRGSAGSLLYSYGTWSEFRGPPVEVVDAVGAGDAFTAALVTGLLAGRPLDAINRHANAVAAFVCTQRGATPELPEGL